jgi:hypothetical protein
MYIILPIVAGLNGDREKAEQLIERELSRVNDSPDMYSQSFRKFAAKFRETDFGQARV